MKFFQNKAVLLITVLGLLLGFSLAKNYQQRLTIEHLQQIECPHPQFDFGEQIFIDIPVRNLINMGEEVPFEIYEHEIDLEVATELMKEQMAKLQEEYEIMLSEHEHLIENHIDRAKQRRAE